MKSLKPSIIEFTNNFWIESNSKNLSISHEIINDELKLKITANYSQIPSRIKLISSNRSDLKIIADIKKMKLKIQIKIQGEELRVDGKKKDDLQEAISAIKAIDIGLPIDFVNFRD